MQALPNVGAYQLAQWFPCSVGFRLLVEGHLPSPCQAASFDILRIRAVALSLAIPKGGGRRCILCCGAMHGLPNILATCAACHAPRQGLLKNLGRRGMWAWANSKIDKPSSKRHLKGYLARTPAQEPPKAFPTPAQPREKELRLLRMS